MERRVALVVEDDPRERDVLVLLLETDGWTVESAEDGAAGLELAIRRTPDLLVTDLQMPSMSGIELAQEMSRRADLDDVPLLGVTSAAGDLFDAAQASGLFATVLRKPVSVGDFLKAVRRVTTAGHTG